MFLKVIYIGFIGFMRLCVCHNIYISMIYGFYESYLRTPRNTLKNSIVTVLLTAEVDPCFYPPRYLRYLRTRFWVAGVTFIFCPPALS